MASRRTREGRPAARRTPMAGRAARRPVAPPSVAPPAAPPPAQSPERLSPAVARAGRRAALVLAGVGVFWVLATWAGDTLGWSTRLRALFDLVALAGFAFALYLTWQVWRLRRAEKG